MSARPCLYRFYNADGDLLYVGATIHLATRVLSHLAEKGWATQIATIRVEWHSTPEAVASAEEAAIRTERPRYNRDGILGAYKPYGRSTPAGGSGGSGVTLAEAARLLGVSRPTVYRMIADGTLSTVATRTGKGRRVSTADIHARNEAAGRTA